MLRDAIGQDLADVGGHGPAAHLVTQGDDLLVQAHDGGLGVGDVLLGLGHLTLDAGEGGLLGPEVLLDDLEGVVDLGQRGLGGVDLRGHPGPLGAHLVALLLEVLRRGGVGHLRRREPEGQSRHREGHAQ